MSKNTNCKKKWHPSRYEVQSKVEEAERKKLEAEKEMEQSKIYTPEDRSKRMSWMEEM